MYSPQPALPIVCFGEILWDLLPDGDFLGGAPLNVACHLHQWGHLVHMLSAVGRDSLGTKALQRLQGAGLSDIGIYQHPTLPTGTVQVTLQENGDARYQIAESVAWDELVFTSSLQQILDGVVGQFPLIFGTLVLRNAHNRELLLSLINRYKPLLCLDVNLRPPYDSIQPLLPFFEQTWFLKMNEEELLFLTSNLPANSSLRSRMELLVQRFRCERVCVTRGADGAVFLCRGQWFEGKAAPVKVVDTIGAGDAFMASMMDAIVRNEEGSTAAVIRACEHGARIAAQRGAQDLF